MAMALNRNIMTSRAFKMSLLECSFYNKAMHILVFLYVLLFME